MLRGVTSIGRSGWPAPRIVAFARGTNHSETKLTVGIPLFSISMLSWIHHVVQLPQLPRPLMTTSTLLAKSSKTDLCIGRVDPPCCTEGFKW